MKKRHVVEGVQTHFKWSYFIFGEVSRVVFVDGSSYLHGTPFARAAFGVSYGRNSRRSFSRYVSGNDHSSTRAEVSAVLAAVDRERGNLDPLVIFSDSQSTVSSFNHLLDVWKINGWRKSNKKPIADADLWMILDAAVEIRQTAFIAAGLDPAEAVTLHHVRGHSSSNEGNTHADYLAKLAARDGVIIQGSEYDSDGDYDYEDVSDSEVDQADDWI